MKQNNMPISKEWFVKIMKCIRAHHDKEEKFNDALQFLDSSSTIALFIYAQYEDLLISYLDSIFDTDMVSYFAYETEWGEKADKYFVTDSDGKEYHIHTIEELYDYLKLWRE